MGSLLKKLINPEQYQLSAIKEELSRLSNEELTLIANKEVRTGFLVNGKAKQYQIAAWQLLRERSHTKK